MSYTFNPHQKENKQMAKSKTISMIEANMVANLNDGFLLDDVIKLSKANALAASNMAADEVRQLVRIYYQTQGMRVQLNNMNKAAKKSESGSSSLFEHFLTVFETFEKQVSKATLKWVEAHEVGKWLIQVHGIGPVIASGILANLDITKAKSHGAFWKFAGISGNPADNVWEKGQKRPWNADLKRLMFILWNSMQYQQTRENNFYGRMVFKPRYQQEWASNYKGKNAETALRRAETVAKSTDAYLWYSGCYNPRDVYEIRNSELSAEQKTKRMEIILGKPMSGVPMLPPAHIEARAGRFTASVFLSHLFDAWYEIHYGKKAAQPYVIAHQNHTHWIENPYVPTGGAAADGMTFDTLNDQMFKTFDVPRYDEAD